MNDFIGDQGIANEHDDFEDCYSSDNESEPSFSNEGSNQYEDIYFVPDTAEQRPTTRYGRRAHNTPESPRRSPGVPKVVRGIPDGACSVVSDVSGMTELNMIAASYYQTEHQQGSSPTRARIQPRDHGGVSLLPRDQSIAMKQRNAIVNKRTTTATRDGTHTNRFEELSDGPQNATDRFDATGIAILPTHMEQVSTSASIGTGNSRGRQELSSEVDNAGVMEAPCVLVSAEEYQAAVERTNNLNNTTRPEPDTCEVGDLIDAYCVRASEEEYQAAVARTNNITTTATAGPNEGAVLRERNTTYEPNALPPSISETPTVSSHGTSNSNSRSHGGTSQFHATRTVSSATPESSTTSVSSKGRGKVVTKTIKIVKKEQVKGAGTARDARSNKSRQKANRNVVQAKTTTYAADGSCIEKIVNADGTTTTITRSAKGKKKNAKSSGASCSSSTASTNLHVSSNSSTASMTSRENRSGRSNGASVMSNGSASRDNRSIKSRTTKQAADGSRTEVIEYADGSKVTQIIVPPKATKRRARR